MTALDIAGALNMKVRPGRRTYVAINGWTVDVLGITNREVSDCVTAVLGEDVRTFGLFGFRRF